MSRPRALRRNRRATSVSAATALSAIDVTMDNVVIGTGITTVRMLFSASELKINNALLLAESLFAVWDSALPINVVTVAPTSVTVTAVADGYEAEFVVPAEQVVGLPLLYFLPANSNAVLGIFGERPNSGQISGVSATGFVTSGQLVS